MPDTVESALEHVTTADGIGLDGILYRAGNSEAAECSVELCILVHGTGSNFYARDVLDRVGQHLLTGGIDVLRINTRGHDIMCSLPGQNGSRLGGAAYEVIDECRFDLAAWLEAMERREYARIALIGHSMGAVKCVYAQAHQPRASVQRLIGISPPSFCHRRLADGPNGDDFLEDYGHAKALSAAGRGHELITSRQPLPLVLTAAGFLAKYGPEDSYDYIKYLPKLSCPTLVTLAGRTLTRSGAFAGQPAALSEWAAASEYEGREVNMRLFEDADINYSTCTKELLRTVVEWLRRV